MTLDEAIAHAREIAECGGECAQDHEQLAEWLEELRGIVRCKDCKHMIHFWHHDDERWQCANEMLDGLDVSPSFYCAWGERKEGGE